MEETSEAAQEAAARREALDALVAGLRAELAAASEAAAAQAASLDETQAELDEQAAELDAAKNRLSAREASLAETLTLLSASRDDLAEARERLEEAGDVEALRADLLQAQDNLTTAEQAQLVQIAATQALRARLRDAQGELSQAEADRLAEVAAAEALRERLRNADTELTAMTLNLEEQRRKAEETLTKLAAAEAARDLLQDANEGQLNEQERQQALLAQANALLLDERARSAESQRQVTLLNQQTAALRNQLESLQALLDAADARDVESQVQIEALGRNLNTALAQVAAEQKRLAEEQRLLAEAERARADLEEAERLRLEAETLDLSQYRSEFFGRVRTILGDREGVQVQGDRFVFSSEVLFAPGSDELGAGGQSQIARVASVLREVADEIPPEINWILRVDGHTDNRPVGRTSPFADNWELSQARALSVVRYLVTEEGIDPDRLAATGFGEFQPVDGGRTLQALARNRRIELKFTEK